MATSFYVYETQEDYKKFYGGREKSPEYQSDVIDMYIFPKSDKIWIVTHIEKHKARPLLTRSIVHFTGGIEQVDKHKDGSEVLVEYEKIRFDPKKMKLKFNPRKIRKPLLLHHVDRYIGNILKKQKSVDYNHRYYDVTKDRINFILMP